MGRSSTTVNLLLSFAPPTVGLAAAMIISSSRTSVLLLSLGLVVIGFLFLLAAKVPALRHGRLVTFGPRSAGGVHRALWWFAAAFIATGTLTGILAHHAR